jgi:N-acylmannosamine kinase
MLNVADIGGTKTSFAQMEGGRILWCVEVPTPKVTSLGLFCEWMCEQWLKLSPLASLSSPIEGLAISTTGIVEKDNVTSLNPQTLDWPSPFPLRRELASISGLPTWVLNDAQAAAWAEYRAIKQSNPSIQRLMYMTISTGIGAGLVLDDVLLRSPGGLASHAGHMTMTSKGPRCGCGRSGCLEALSSGKAIQAQIKALGLNLTTQEAFEQRHEPSLEKIFKEAAHWVAQAIANVHAVVELDLVVIGGGLGLQPDFIEWILRSIQDQPSWSQIQILPANCGRQSCLQGAGDWAKAQQATAINAPIF